MQDDLRAGQPVQPNDAAVIIDAIETCLSHRRSFDEAIGLTLNDAKRLGVRDELLRTAAAMLPDGTAWQRAQELERRWKAYFVRRWPRCRHCEACPELEGSLEAILWEVLKLRTRALGYMRIYQLIKH